MNITIQHQECQIGPYTLEEVNRRLREGKIKPDALAWQEGTNDWVPLKTISGVGVTVSASPVPKPQVVKPKSYQKPLLWCAAALAVLLLIDISVRLQSSSAGTAMKSNPETSNKREATQPSNSKSSQPTKPKGDPVSMRGFVETVLDEGVLVRCRDASQLYNEDQTDGHSMNGTEELCYLTGHPRQRELLDGHFVGVIAQQAGKKKFGSKTLPCYEYVRNATRRIK